MTNDAIKYRTITPDDIVFEYNGAMVALYVYSIANNPNGAGLGTDAQFLGYVGSVSEAQYLWKAAIATSHAICGENGQEEIGLCVEGNE